MRCASLHSDQFKLDEFGRAIVWRIDRKMYTSCAFIRVNDVIAAIDEYMQGWNTNPKQFVWRTSVESIMAKLSRCR